MSEAVRVVADKMLRNVEDYYQGNRFTGDGSDTEDGGYMNVLDMLGKLSTIVRSHLSVDGKSKPIDPEKMSDEELEQVVK